jgi:hypothetical protein
VDAIVIPDRPITADLSPAQVADLIDAAATLIETDGLEVGSFWADALFGPYEPGASVCTVGALAVTCGYRTPVDVEDGFVGDGSYDPETGITGPDHPHPVFAAVLAALGFKEAEDLYNWSDSAGDREVVAELRYVAAELRARAGA